MYVPSSAGEIPFTRHPAIPPFLCKVRLQADDPRVDDDEYPSTFGSTRASSDKPLKSLKSLTCRFVRQHAGSSCRGNSLLRLVKVAYVCFDVSTWRDPSQASYSCMLWCSVFQMFQWGSVKRCRRAMMHCQSPYFKGKNQNESNIVKPMSKQTKRHGNCSF